MILVLVAVWCALWGEVSLANIGSGLVVAVAVNQVRPRAPTRPCLRRAWALGRFGALVAIDMLRSAFAIAREALTPMDRSDEIEIECAVPEGARPRLLLLVAGISVTPGTAVVDVDEAASTLRVHLLHGQDRRRAEAHIGLLTALAEEAS